MDNSGGNKHKNKDGQPSIPNVFMHGQGMPPQPGPPFMYGPHGDPYSAMAQQFRAQGGGQQEDGRDHHQQQQPQHPQGQQQHQQQHQQHVPMHFQPPPPGGPGTAPHFMQQQQHHQQQPPPNVQPGQQGQQQQNDDPSQRQGGNGPPDEQSARFMSQMMGSGAMMGYPPNFPPYFAYWYPQGFPNFQQQQQQGQPQHQQPQQQQPQPQQGVGQNQGPPTGGEDGRNNGLGVPPQHQHPDKQTLDNGNDSSSDDEDKKRPMKKRKKKKRSRRNLCLCEQVKTPNFVAGACRKKELMLGKDHWQYGAMYQLPKKGCLRGGVDIRDRWLHYLGGMTDEMLESKSVLRPEIRWTHFPEKYFNHESFSAEPFSNMIRRRRLKYTVPVTSETNRADIINTGKHQGSAIPVPDVDYTKANWEKEFKAWLAANPEKAQGVLNPHGPPVAEIIKARQEREAAAAAAAAAAATAHHNDSELGAHLLSQVNNLEDDGQNSSALEPQYAPFHDGEGDNGENVDEENAGDNDGGPPAKRQKKNNNEDHGNEEQ